MEKFRRKVISYWSLRTVGGTMWRCVLECDHIETWYTWYPKR